MNSVKTHLNRLYLIGYKIKIDSEILTNIVSISMNTRISWWGQIVVNVDTDRKLVIKPDTVVSLSLGNQEHKMKIYEYDLTTMVDRTLKSGIRYEYCFDLRDPLFFLTLHSHNRSYLNPTLSKLIKSIFGSIKYNLKSQNDACVMNIVQYNESDFNFLLRIATLYNVQIIRNPQDGTYLITDKYDSLVVNEDKLSYIEHTEKVINHEKIKYNVYDLTERQKIEEPKWDYYIRLGSEKDKVKSLHRSIAKHLSGSTVSKRVILRITTTKLLTGSIINFDKQKYIVYRQQTKINMLNEGIDSIHEATEVELIPENDILPKHQYKPAIDRIFIGQVVSSSSSKNKTTVIKKRFLTVSLYIESDKEALINVRMSSLIAGPKYGDIWIPRVGTNIMIAAEDEMLSSFIFLKSVYLDSDEPESSDTASVIRTSASGSEGSEADNLIRFDDSDAGKLILNGRKIIELIAPKKILAKAKDESITATSPKILLNSSDTSMISLEVSKLLAQIADISIEMGSGTLTIKNGAAIIQMKPAQITINVGDTKIELGSQAQISVGSSLVKIGSAAVDMKSGSSSISLAAAAADMKSGASALSLAAAAAELKSGGSKVNVTAASVMIS